MPVKRSPAELIYSDPTNYKYNPYDKWATDLSDPSPSYDEVDDRYDKGITQDANGTRHLDYLDQAKRIQQDMGLGPYAPPTSISNEYLPSEPGTTLLGVYHRDQRNIKFSPYPRATTMAHEAAHAMDAVYSQYDAPPYLPWWNGLNESEVASRHHKYYGNFSEDFPQQLFYQRKIEAGANVPPQAYAQFPWLKEVNPLSSNPVANPWRYNQDKPEISPELYQMLGEDARLKETIDMARMHEHKMNSGKGILTGY